MNFDIKTLDPDGDLKRFSKPDLVRAAQEVIKTLLISKDSLKVMIKGDGGWYESEGKERAEKSVESWKLQAKNTGNAVDNLASTVEYQMARIITLEAERDGVARATETETARLNGIIEGLKGA